MRHLILRRLPGLAAVIAALALGLTLLPTATDAAGPPASPVSLMPLPVAFASHIGIDTHETTGRVVTSVYYPAGAPRNFELIGSTGTATPFGTASGFTDEIQPGTVRASGCQGGFQVGEMFAGTGVNGQVARYSPEGVQTALYDLDGSSTTFAGRVTSVFQDRHCVIGGTVVVATHLGRIYRINSGGAFAPVGVGIGTHIEGLMTVPNDARYGPWAGKIVVGAPAQSRIYTVDPTTLVTTVNSIVSPSTGVPINVEDLEIVPANENFFAVEWGAGRIVGAPAGAFADKVGDIIAVQGVPNGQILNLRWDADAGAFQVDLIATGNWFEQVTFSRAGIGPIAPIAPAFSQPGSVPAEGTCLCLPPYMLRDGGSQDWWVRASGDEPLQVTGKGMGINAAEAGTLTFRLYSPAGVLLQTLSVAQPAAGEVSATFASIASPTAGGLYRVNVSVTSPPSGPVARHYRIEAIGATLMGTSSPTPSQSEHDRSRWIVNVNAHENVAVRVVPGPEAGATTGTVRVYDPHGVLRDTKSLNQIAGASLISSPDAGQWVVEVDVNGHYTIEKIDGADRGIYVDWRTWGKGDLTVTLTRNGNPNPMPVDVQVVDVLTNQVVATAPGALGAVSFPGLPAGAYQLVLPAEGIAWPFAIACNGDVVLNFDLPNVPPTTTPQTVFGTEDVPVGGIDLFLGLFDPDSTTFTVTSVSDGSFGIVVTNGFGIATYTPAPNFSGTDTFTYVIDDGDGGTATGTVTVVLHPVNDPPSAQPDAAATDEDVPVTIDVLANDVDIDSVTLTVVSATAGANGTTVVNGDGTVTYTPNPGFSGVDTFTYTVSDGDRVATTFVEVHVATVNAAPLPLDDAATTDEDEAVVIDVLSNDLDADGDTLTVTSATAGANGSTVVNGDGTVTYTPSAGFSGVDTFTYTVSDGEGGEATATVTVTVEAVNAAPVAVDDAATTNAGTAVTVAVLANDSDEDGDTLVVTSATAGANGSTVVNGDGTVTYTPSAGFSGVDTFTYTVSDGEGGEATANVTVTVNAVQVDGRRMTGGGNIAVGQGRNASRWTWGLEIRCDGSQGNFQYQDHSGGNFHLTGLTSVLCSDDPAVNPGARPATFDTMQVTGTGRWNGVNGYRIEAVIVDAGEPGRNDRLVVTVRTAGGTVVSTVSGTLSGGNHQAHR